MRAATYLLFDGVAEEALHFYMSVFPDAEVLAIHHYPASADDMAGKLLPSRLQIAGQIFILADNPNPQDFTFTPAMSTFIEFDDEAELEMVHDMLCAEGDALMPLDDYGFSQHFAWIQDKYGVSWQLTLP